MGLLCTFTHKFMCPAQTSVLISKSVYATAYMASPLRCLTGVWCPHPQNPFLTCQPLLSPQASCLDSNGKSLWPGAWAEHCPGTLYSATDPLTPWLEYTYRRTRVNDLLSIIRWKRKGSSVLRDRGISEPRLCRLGCELWLWNKQPETQWLKTMTTLILLTDLQLGGQGLAGSPSLLPRHQPEDIRGQG